MVKKDFIKNSNNLRICLLYLCFVASLISPIALLAQLKYPKVSKDLLVKTNFEIDSNAPAVILYKAAQTDFEWNGKNAFKTVTIHKAQIKILKNSSLSLANISIPFLAENNYEKIVGISAKVYNWTNNKIEITTLQKKDIYTVVKNFALSEIKIVLPQIKLGSIFELSYTIEKESYTNINTWNFQNDLPTIQSQYIINIPEYFTFNTKITAPPTVRLTKKIYYQNLQIPGKSSRYITTQNQYSLSNIPATITEPYQTNIADYRYKLDITLRSLNFYEEEITLNQDWNAVANWVTNHELIGQQLKRKITFDTIPFLLKTSTNQLDSIMVIYKWLQYKMQWSQVYDLYCFNLKTAVDNSWGNSAELNLLLYHQLIKYKLPANLLIASTKKNGSVYDSFPATNQFNTILVYSKIDQNELPYILDLTNTTATISHQPNENLINTKGLLILDNDSAQIISLTEYHVAKTYHMAITIQVENDGKIFTSGMSTIVGTEALYYSKLKSPIKGNTLFNDTKKDITISKIKTNTYTDTLPKTEINYSYTDSSLQNQPYIALNYNYIPNWHKNPFLQNTRISDIDFSTKTNYQIFTNYILPQNVSIAMLPKSIKVKTENNELFFERNVEQLENNIKIQLSFYINKAIIDIKDYAIVQQFFEIMFKKLEEPIVLEKTKQ